MLRSAGGPKTLKPVTRIALIGLIMRILTGVIRAIRSISAIRVPGVHCRASGPQDSTSRVSGVSCTRGVLMLCAWRVATALKFLP